MCSSAIILLKGIAPLPVWAGLCYLFGKESRTASGAGSMISVIHKSAMKDSPALPSYRNLEFMLHKMRSGQIIKQNMELSGGDGKQQFVEHIRSIGAPPRALQFFPLHVLLDISPPQSEEGRRTR
jgi:hypothetical protein